MKNKFLINSINYTSLREKNSQKSKVANQVLPAILNLNKSFLI